MSEQTDTIEAVARAIADTTDFDGDRMASRYADSEIRDIAQAAIASHTKALIENAGGIVAEIMARPNDAPLPTEYLLDQAAATIAALRAEIERAKEEGVRAGIEAAFLEVDGMGTRRFTRDMIAMLALAGRSIRALDAAAIAKGV